MSNLQVGKANYNANRGEKLTFFRLGMKDNQRELTLRIAPPIKDLAEKGMYATYVKQHFGYSMTGRGDKRFPVTFNCIERKDKMKNVVQNCPECDEINLRKADIEAKTAKLKADGLSEEAIDAQLRVAKAWLKEHNCDKKWNLLAKNESGTWGYLALSHKAFEDFSRELKELAAIGFADPLGVEEGVWFRFTRSGTTFNDVKDSCSAVKIPKGKGQIEIKTDTLTEKDFQQLESLPSLTTLGRRITYEQIARLVQSGGDETVVKSVFEAAQPRQETSSVRTTGPVQTVKTEPETAPAPAVSPAPAAQPVQAQAPVDLAAQIELLRAQLAAATAAPAAKVNAVQPTPSPSLVKKLDMTPDDFLSEYGPGEDD